MILALVMIVFTMLLIMAVRGRIHHNDLKKQMTDYDENSYS